MQPSANLQQEIRILVEEYLQHYVERNSAILSFFSSDFSGYTQDGTALIKDCAEWVNCLLKDFSDLSGPLNVNIHDVSIKEVSKQVITVYVFFNVHLADESHSLLNTPLSQMLVFLLEPKGWKIVHCNVFTPYRKIVSDMASLNYWQIQNSELEKLVNERTRELHEKEEFYRMLTEDTLDVLWRADSELRITYISPSDERLRGFKADEVIGRHVFELFNEEGVAIVRAAYQKRLAAEAAGEPLGFVSFEVPHLCKDGSVVWGEVQSKALRDENGKIIGFHGVTRENTLRKQLHDEVKQQAFYDALTQLPNRRLLTELLQKALSGNKRSCSFGAVMFIDLDNFKPLNDRHGHLAGDRLLIEVGQRLKSCVREKDCVARFGGDEFVVMLPELSHDAETSKHHAATVAEKIRLKLSEVYLIQRRHDDAEVKNIEHYCSASIGVYVFKPGHTETEDILKFADKAMYKAKADGRNRIRFYEETIEADKK